MAHGHAHGHGAGDDDEPPPPPRVRRLLTMAIAPFVVAALVGLLVLWPRGDGPELEEGLGLPTRLVEGTVDDRSAAPCLSAPEGSDIECVLLDVRLTSGPDEGDVIPIEVFEDAGTTAPGEGDRLVLSLDPDATPGFEYQWTGDFQRRAPLLWLGLLFAVAVVALGRWRGVRALVGLAISMVVLVSFVLPAILEGKSPIWVAIVGAAVVMFVALYAAHGFHVRTSIAVLGTLASLVLTGLLAWGFLAAGHFTGLASDEAGFLRATAGQVDLRGLLLAGIIIGSLGVLDDVTVTQASAVWELHLANPAYRAAELYRAGLRIGRDHIASTVNTLVLAYAGASLPLLVLFTLADQSLGDVLNSELVAQEVVRTLVGSVGLVASVPVTTALAAVVVAAGGADTGEPPAGGWRDRLPRRRRPAAGEPPAGDPDWQPPKREREWRADG